MQVLGRKSLTLAGLILTSLSALNGQGVSQSAISTPTSGPTLASLSGKYTFSVHGALVGGNSISREAVGMGSFIADGNGKIVSGEEDINSAVGPLVQLPLTGSYTINNNGTGTLTLVTSQLVQTFSLYISQISASGTSATLLETDGLSGASGFLTEQSVVNLKGNFHFNLSGETFVVSGTPNATAVGGVLTITQQTANGTVSFFVGDAGHGTSSITPNTTFAASLMSLPDQNGRFVLSAQFGGTSAPPTHFVCYVVDATHFNLLLEDAPSTSVPLEVGSAIQ